MSRFYPGTQRSAHKHTPVRWSRWLTPAVGAVLSLGTVGAGPVGAQESGCLTPLVNLTATGGSKSTGLVVPGPRTVTITSIELSTADASPLNQSIRFVMPIGSGSSSYTPDLTATSVTLPPSSLPAAFAVNGGTLFVHHWNTSADGFSGNAGPAGGPLRLEKFCYVLSAYPPAPGQGVIVATPPTPPTPPTASATPAPAAAAPTTVAPATLPATTTTTIASAVKGILVEAPVAQTGVLADESVAFTGFRGVGIARAGTVLVLGGLALLTVRRRRGRLHRSAATGSE